MAFLCMKQHITDSPSSSLRDKRLSDSEGNAFFTVSPNYLLECLTQGTIKRMPPTIVQFMLDMTFENTGPRAWTARSKVGKVTGCRLGTAAAWMVRPQADRPGLQNQFPPELPHSCFQVQCPYTWEYPRLNLNHCLSPLLSHPHWIYTPGHIPCKHHSWSTGCSCGHLWLGPQNLASPLLPAAGSASWWRFSHPLW